MDDSDERSACGEGSSGLGSVVVPKDQVQVFTDTLKRFAERCEKSQATIEAKCSHLEEVQRCADAKVEDMTKIMKDMEDMLKKCTDQTTAARKEIQNAHCMPSSELSDVRQDISKMKQLQANAAETLRDAQSIERRVQLKESLVCTYVGIVQRSEAYTRNHYKRTVYADTLCKEICDAAQGILEASLRVLKRIVELPGTASGTDGTTEAEDRKALSEVLDDITFKTRYLRPEVGNMERIVDVLDAVGLLDEALRVCTGELTGICTDCVDVTKMRKRLEAFVRQAIVYDTSKYASHAEYERHVTAETDRRLQASGTTGLSVITAVVASLRRTGVMDPGATPVGDETGQIPPPTCPAHHP